MENRYKENAGCENREEYLERLAEDKGVDQWIVNEMAFFLGEDEDFDGLVSMIEDIC